MATQIIQFEGPSLSQIGSGTITAVLYSGATVVGSLASIAENGTRPGRYTGTVTDKPAATYDLIIRYNGYDVSDHGYKVTLQLADGTYTASGGGDATAENQVTILAKLPTTGRAASAEAVWTYTPRTVTSGAATPIALPEVAGTIAGFPEQLRVGTARSEALGNAIHVFIRDANNAPVTSFGSKTFVDGDFSAEMSISQGSRNSLVSPTCVWVPGGGGEGYVRVSMTSDQSRRATEGAATMQLVFKWGTEEVVIATQDIEWLEKVARTLQ